MTGIFASVAFLTALLVGAGVGKRRGPVQAVVAALSTLLVLGGVFVLLEMLLVSGMD